MDLLERTLNEIEKMNVDPQNLIAAIAGLAGVLHRHGLDEEAAAALKECGIEFETEVK